MRLAFLVSDKGRLMNEVIKNYPTRIAWQPIVCIADRYCPALEIAAENDIPAMVVDRKKYKDASLFSDDVLEILQEHEIDLVLLTFNSLLRGKILDAYKYRLLNYHPSLLPAFTGFKARCKTLCAGTTIGGGTLHFVDSGIDSGPIVVQWAVALHPEDTPATYGNRQFELGVQATTAALRWFSENRVVVQEDRVKITGVVYGKLPINPQNA